VLRLMGQVVHGGVHTDISIMTILSAHVFGAQVQISGTIDTKSMRAGTTNIIN